MKGRFQPTTVGNMTRDPNGGYVCHEDYADQVALVIECRSSVRLDLTNYERVLDEMDRNDQQNTDAYDAVSKERTRLFRLLNQIDALMLPPNVELCGERSESERTEG